MVAIGRKTKKVEHMERRLALVSGGNCYDDPAGDAYTGGGMNYRYRIYEVLQGAVRATDRKEGYSFDFLDERRHKTAYESAWRIPVGYSYKQVKGKWDALAAACGAPIELDDRGGVVIIRVVTEDFPKHLKVNERDLLPDQLLMGYDRLRKPVYHPLHSHILVGGASGSGKTDWLRFIVYQLVKQGYDIRLVDLKGFSFFPFEWIPSIEIACDLEEAYYMIMRTYRDLVQREREVKRNKNRNVIESFRPIAIIIDEAAQIAPKQNSGEAKKIAQLCDEYVAKIAQKGREPKVSLIYCTQRPDADTINPQVKGCVEAAVAFRCKTRTNSEIILDRGGAEKISSSTPGRCIYSGVRDALIQAPYVGNDDAWSDFLMGLKTEVVHEGRSTRRTDERLEYPADYVNVPSSSTTFPRLRLTGKTSEPSAERVGTRKVSGKPETRRHVPRLALNPTRPERDTDTAEIDPVFFS